MVAMTCARFGVRPCNPLRVLDAQAYLLAVDVVAVFAHLPADCDVLPSSILAAGRMEPWIMQRLFITMSFLVRCGRGGSTLRYFILETSLMKKKRIMFFSLAHWNRWRALGWSTLVDITSIWPRL